VAAGLGALIVAAAVEGGVIAAFDPDFESLGARLTLQALLALTLAWIAFVIARPGPGLAAPASLGFRRALRSPWGVAAIAYFAYIGCALVLAALIKPEQEDVTRDLGWGESELGSFAAGFLIVAAAPVSEEIFFRGFMFGGFRRRLPFVAAAAISAGIWGIFHYTGPDSLGVCLQLAIFGLALAWLYERTGSIWPPIAVHTINNALAFAILTS
jgi:uncharacterized protein